MNKDILLFTFLFLFLNNQLKAEQKNEMLVIEKEKGYKQKTYSHLEDTILFSFSGETSLFPDDAAKTLSASGEIAFFSYESPFFIMTYAQQTMSQMRVHTHQTNTSYDERGKTNISSFGAGVGHRLKFFFYEEEPFFQHVTAATGPSILQVREVSTNYIGIELRAGYSLIYRASSSFHYGFKAVYHTGMAQRDEINNTEATRDRRLYYTYITAGIELGLYF